MGIIGSHVDLTSGPQRHQAEQGSISRLGFDDAIVSPVWFAPAALGRAVVPALEIRCAGLEARYQPRRTSGNR